MTLTDIIDLRKQLLPCKTAAEAAVILDEYGEDCDADSARAVFEGLKKTPVQGFSVKDGQPLLRQKEIRCPDCKNTSPDTIMSGPALLAGDASVWFGCCQCGTKFSL